MRRIALALAAAGLIGLGFGSAAHAQAAFDCSGVNYGGGAFGNTGGTAASTPGSIISGLALTDPANHTTQSLDGAVGTTASNVADKILQTGGNAALPTQVVGGCGLGPAAGFPN